MPHPSLVLWNGNNENIWGYEDWGWQDRSPGGTWGARLLPRAAAAASSPSGPDPAVLAGQPVLGRAGRATPTTTTHGSTHIWDVWNTDDYTRYREYRPRFVAEFGWQAPPAWATLPGPSHDEPLTPDSPGVLPHQKAERRQRQAGPRAGAALPRPGAARRLALR